MKSFFSTLCTWGIWLFVPLFFAGCSPTPSPDPKPLDPDPVLTIAVGSPFLNQNGNWAGDVPAEGVTSGIVITSNGDWTASSNAAWCTLSATGGTSRDKNVTLTVAPNSSENARNASVTVKSGELSRSIEVRQAGVLPFSVSPNSVEIPAGGGNFSVTVTCQTTFKVSDKPAWVETQGSTPTKLSFSVGPNPEFNERQGVLVICDDIGTCLPVTLTQKAREGTAFHVNWTDGFYRRSLIMDFTATWCAFCPRMQRGIALVEEQYPEKFEIVALHQSQSTLAFTGSGTLANNYRISAYPTAIIDGRCKVGNSGNPEMTAERLLPPIEESLQKLTAFTAIGLNSGIEGDKVYVYVDTYFKKAGTYTLTVLVMESGIVTSQSDNDMINYLTTYSDVTDEEYVHDHVARIALTPVSGESFTLASDNTHLMNYYTATIPAKCNKENLSVIAYVQRAYDGSVSKLQPTDFDGSYVDNCVSAPLGVVSPPQIINGSSGGNENFENGKPINW